MTAKTDGTGARRSGVRVPGPRSAGAEESVQHLSRADRVARGKAARAAAPLESHAGFTPGGSRDPVGLLAGQAESRVPELVPVRHGRMLVSAFTFYRGAALPMAADLAADARVGAAGAAVRGRAPVQFRRVRVTGAAAGLRRQRLRRDAARPVRVGRQAAGREPGGGGAGQRVPGQGPPHDRPGGGRGLPHRDACLRGAAAAGGLVRARGHRAGPRRGQVPAQGEEVQGQPRRLLAKAHTSDSTKALGKLTTVDGGQRRIISDPPTDRPGRGGLRRRAGRRDLRADPRRAGHLPAHPAVRPAPPAGAVQAGPGGPQGRRGRQRRHPRLGRADGRRRRRAAVLAGQGGAAVGPRGVLRGAASTRTRASGSSPGST